MIQNHFWVTQITQVEKRNSQQPVKIVNQLLINLIKKLHPSHVYLGVFGTNLVCSSETILHGFTLHENKEKAQHCLTLR